MSIKKIKESIDNGYLITENQLYRLLKYYKKDGLKAYHRVTRYDDNGYEIYIEWRLTCAIGHSTPCSTKVFTREDA